MRGGRVRVVLVVLRVTLALSGLFALVGRGRLTLAEEGRPTGGLGVFLTDCIP